MHTTSATYNAIKSGVHNVDVKITINGVEYGSDQIERLNCNADTFGNEIPAVGNVIARTLNVSLLTPSVAIPIGAEIKLYACIYNRTQRSEWINKGTFYVDTRKRNLSNEGLDLTTEFTAYDALCKTDNTISLTYPITDAAAVSAIASAIGVQSDISITSAYSLTEQDDITMREILGYVGAMYGGNIYINDDGKLDLMPLGKDATGIAIDPSVLTIGATCAGISKVIMHTMDGTTYESGNTTGGTLNVDCPWSSQAIANALLPRVSGYSYTPFSASDTIIDVAMELGDTISCDDLKERVYSMSISYGAACIANLSAPDVKEQERHYYGINRIGGVGGGSGTTLAQAIIKAVQTDAGLSQITTYDEETGYAIAEAALYATIIDNDTGAIKTSRISSSVVRDVNGNLKSLAQLTADVIELNGHLRVLENFTVEEGWMFTRYLSTVVMRAQQINYVTSSGDLMFEPKVIEVNGEFITVLAKHVN